MRIATLPRGSMSLGRHQIVVDEQATARVAPVALVSGTG